MCTKEPKHDYCGVDLMQTEESSNDSLAPVCSRLLKAPSLNAILKGTLSPVENIADIEHDIWYPDTPETFLQASLQFLENKLHSRIFHTSPTPSGKIVLSDGFIFSPIYPNTPQDSRTTIGECVMKVHNFSEDEGAFSWNDPKRVNSVVYSCISIPSEYGEKSTQDKHGSTNRLALDDTPWGSQRDIGIQTSTELFTPVTGMSSSMVSDEETQPISNFSEYVQYCHSIVKPSSQLFHFGNPTQNQVSDYETSDPMQELKYDSTAEYPFQPIKKEKDSLPNSARTYASHYRSSPSKQEGDSSGRENIPPYETSAIQRSTGPSSKTTTSTTTVSSAKSFVSNRTEHSVYEKYHQTEVASSTGSTKSVYYYARISASFFSFLNRATQKNKIEKNSRASSIVPNVSSATPSAISIPKPKLDETTSNTDEEKERKLTTAKLNVLRRFMNFFGGAKASKEYGKIKDPTAAIIDVKTGFFDNDNIFESDSKSNPTENNETKFKCNSFSETGKNATSPEWLANVVASERNVEKKESKQLSNPSRKAQTKAKAPRSTLRDSMRDTDKYICRTALVQENRHHQKCLESTETDLTKKPTAIVSSIFGSKTSYSKTVCKDILKLRFEGDPAPVTATDTSHDENDCCICYKPPQCYRNKDALIKEKLNYFHNEFNESGLIESNNDYICYARIPENQRTQGNYRQQPIPSKQQPQHKNLLRSFFKSRNDNKYSTSTTYSTGEQTPQGILVHKPRILVHNQYRPKTQEYETQQQDPQSTQRPILIETPITCNSKTNPPVVRKQNAYLIEKPQVNPARITRLLPEDKPKVWSGGMRRESFPPNINSNYNETSDMNSCFSVMSKTLESTEVNSSYSAMPTMITTPFTTSSEINSSLSTVPTTMAVHLPGIKGFQKYKHPSIESTTQNTISTSSSEFDGPTTYINNTVSDSSRSSYWLPPKRLARESRELPKMNPSNNIFQMKQSFSKEVIKLFQRAPKSFRRR